MGAFCDGKAEKWGDIEAKKGLVIAPGEKLEITAGIKIVLLTSENLEWKPLMLSADDVDVDRILAETTASYGDPKALEYSARRNIEHILSACSVPVTDKFVWDYDRIDDVPTKELAESLVALTCGDLSGHRVCSSAS